MNKGKPRYGERTAGAIALFMLLMIMMLAMLAGIDLAAAKEAESNTTQTDASLLITKLERNITSLKERGFNTPRLDDALMDAKASYADRKFDQVLRLYSESILTISKMMYVSSEINMTSMLLDEAKKRELNISESMGHYTLSLSDFRNNNLDAAQKEIAQSKELVTDQLMTESTMIIADLKELAAALASTGINANAVNRTTADILAAERSKDFIRLFILASRISEMNTSIAGLLTIKEKMNRLEADGYSINRINDTIAELESLLDAGEYTQLSKRYNETISLIGKIYSVDKGIKKTEAGIGSPELAGIDLTEASELLNTSKSEFDLENYEKSEDYLARAKASLAEAEQANIFATILNKAKMRFDPISFLKKNWLSLILAILIGGIVIKVGGLFLVLKKSEQKLAKLKKEEEAITELMIKLQEEYFKEKIIDKDTYAAENNSFEKRLTQISEEIPLLIIRIKEKREKLAKMRMSKHKTADDHKATDHSKAETDSTSTNK
ncbi:MAG: hypothetical protein V1866_00660 [archaeon]